MSLYGNIRLSDQICTEDLLTSQKFLSANYNTAVQESFNADLRKDFMEIQRQEQDAAFRVFSYMNQKGWYKTSPADTRMIQEVRSQAQQIASQVGAGFPGVAGGAPGFTPGIAGGAGFGAPAGGGGFGYQGGAAGPYGGAGAGGGFGHPTGTGAFGPGAGGYTGYQGAPGGFGGQAGGTPGFGSPSFEAGKELSDIRFEGPAETGREPGEKAGKYGTYGGVGGSDGTPGRTGRSTVVHGDTGLEDRSGSAEVTGRGTGNTFEGSTGFEERSGFPGGTSGRGRRM